MPLAGSALYFVRAPENFTKTAAAKRALRGPDRGAALMLGPGLHRLPSIRHFMRSPLSVHVVHLHCVLKYPEIIFSPLKKFLPR